MSVIDKVKDTRSFLEECVTELQKVTWPDWDQLRSATIVVGVFTALVSLVIWIMDKTSDVVVSWIMGIFGA
ncbi:MAG TPA: preprotein translocase subunit SecE [Gemmatimonadetes bacterium]|nr:preprotein translocase subunit SecE [Gemmatimonadota bacterium]|tara:strand:+ start:242 stop:454 length:213 start_codon:yes stop_codon:yes gene_type:complete